jgi:hypothetical protein
MCRTILILQLVVQTCCIFECFISILKSFLGFPQVSNIACPFKHVPLRSGLEVDPTVGDLTDQSGVRSTQLVLVAEWLGHPQRVPTSVRLDKSARAGEEEHYNMLRRKWKPSLPLWSQGRWQKITLLRPRCWNFFLIFRLIGMDAYLHLLALQHELPAVCTPLTVTIVAFGMVQVHWANCEVCVRRHDARWTVRPHFWLPHPTRLTLLRARPCNVLQSR